MYSEIYCAVVTAVLLAWVVPALQGEELCLRGSFEAQARALRRRVMLAPRDRAKAERLFQDLRNTLRRRWKDVEVYPYGSLVTGVAIKASDADCSFKIPNDRAMSEIELIAEATKLFRAQPDLYSQVMLFNSSALITVYHNPTGRYCDLSYSNKKAISSSRVFSYFIKLDERIPPLVSILKYWAKIHQITGPEVLSNFGLYSLIMFYLQQKKIGPPISVLQKKFRNKVDVRWNLSFNEIPFIIKNTESLYELLGGFFKYYSEFDFKEYIVSPFVGRPVHRREFADIKNVPPEFSLYKAFMRKRLKRPLNITTEICIQEPFEHNRNPAKRIEHENASRMFSHINFCAKMFKELKSDQFLRSILIKDIHNEKYFNPKKVVLDKIRKLKECINRTIN